MKKNGFIFIETITVLVIVILSLTMVLGSYSIVIKRNNIMKYYNRPNDIYALYTFMNFGTTATNNYYKPSITSFYTTKAVCSTNSKINTFTSSNCNEVFSTLNMVGVGIITDVQNELDTHYSNYDSGLITFIDHLRKKDDEGNKIAYAIGVFYVNREYYYASIRIEV